MSAAKTKNTTTKQLTSSGRKKRRRCCMDISPFFRRLMTACFQECTFRYLEFNKTNKVQTIAHTSRTPRISSPCCPKSWSSLGGVLPGSTRWSKGGVRLVHNFHFYSTRPRKPAHLSAPRPASLTFAPLPPSTPVVLPPSTTRPTNSMMKNRDT